MGEVVPARTSPTLHPPSPSTVLWLSWLKVSQRINCRDLHLRVKKGTSFDARLKVYFMKMVNYRTQTLVGIESLMCTFFHSSSPNVCHWSAVPCQTVLLCLFSHPIPFMHNETKYIYVCTKITEVNLSASVYKLFHEDLSMQLSILT